MRATEGLLLVPRRPTSDVARPNAPKQKTLMGLDKKIVRPVRRPGGAAASCQRQSTSRFLAKLTGAHAARTCAHQYPAQKRKERQERQERRTGGGRVGEDEGATGTRTRVSAGCEYTNYL